MLGWACFRLCAIEAHAKSLSAQTGSRKMLKVLGIGKMKVLTFCTLAFAPTAMMISILCCTTAKGNFTSLFNKHNDVAVLVVYITSSCTSGVH